MVGLIFATYPLLVFISAPICGLMVSNSMLFPILLYIYKEIDPRITTTVHKSLSSISSFNCIGYFNFIAMVALTSTRQEIF